MSGFLAGLVRRGAGLPTPGIVRPTGFKNVAMPLEGVEAASEASPAAGAIHREPVNSAEIAIPDYSRPELPAEQPATDDRTRDLSPARQGSRRASMEIPRSSPTPAQPVASRNVTLRARDFDSGSVTARRSEDPQERGPVAPVPMLPPSAFANLDISPSSQPADKSDALDHFRRTQETQVEKKVTVAESISVQVMPRQEPAAVAQTVGRASVDPSRADRAALEQRSIHVRIGRVEIRSTQAAPPLRATRRQPTDGFADLKLARTHLDRGAW